jgi:hypothetical protein
MPRAQVANQKNITPGKAAKLRAEIRIMDMKKYICLLAGAALLASCEQKETTVTNPPAEKKESSTYTEKKESGTYEFTVINTPPAETTTKEKTEVNANTSPAPSP